MSKTLFSLMFLLFLLFLSCFSANAATTGTVQITGRILDIDGKPVAGAEVFIYDSSSIRRPADFISPRTNADGQYKLTLPRNKYWAVARVRKGDQYGPLLANDRHSGEPVILEAEDSESIQLDFTVVDLREAVRQKQKVRVDHQKVTGRVVDSSGKPIKDIFVFADTNRILHGVPDYVSAWTGEDGSYTIYLPAGRFFIATSDIFPPPNGTTLERELIVKPEKKITSLDFLYLEKNPALPAKDAYPEKQLD